MTEGSGWHSVRAGRLVLDGHEIPHLVARAGRTPCFVYLRSAITERARRLRRALPAGARLLFSPKANPMPAVIQHLTSLVDGFDVASHAEMRRVLDAGADPSACLFTGPGKDLLEIRAAVATGVVVNIESAAQLEQVVTAGDVLGKRPAVALRLNARFGPARDDMRDHDRNQFGIDAEQAPAVLSQVRSLDLAFRGFHVFWGSQHRDPRAVAEAQRRGFLLAMSVAERVPGPVEFVNVGGGFPVPFFADEPELDLDAAGAAIGEWAEPAQKAYGCTLAFEFGRYLVGSAGYYVCQVLDRKRIADQTFLVTDGGLHHHLLASGAFGRAEHRNFRVMAADRGAGKEIERVNVVGRLCSSMDRVATGVRLPRTEPGEYLVLPNSGAYGPSFSGRDFLSHPPAVEMLI
jgi:diaminopimelate decarboxylase